MIETKNVEKLFKGNPKLGSFTVGAVNVISPYTLEPYSSHGPTYGPGGTPTGGIIKPDIVGYANVSTESHGVGKFNGTSAATPHISGVATLIKEAYPGYSVSQLQSLLEDRAIDQGVSGKDNEYGSGRLYLGSPRRDDIFIRGDNNWASL